MSVLKSIVLAGALVLTVLAWAPAPARANTYGSRQYYSNWSYHAKRGYYYRTYYYKPHADYYGYKHHYVIYYSARPYYYYYNPYKKYYWGRCPVRSEGKARYSLLPEEARKSRLEDIPEKAFPDFGPTPPIPDSNGKDGGRLDLPPDDLPGEDPLPPKSK
jgi:hypothetical protein